MKGYLPPEGAWWLRERVECRVPVRFGTTIVDAHEVGGWVSLRPHDAEGGGERALVVDHVIAGSGYVVDVDRLGFLHPDLARAIQRHERAPRLNSILETSVAGLHFADPASAIRFGPLFRFVVGAETHRPSVDA